MANYGVKYTTEFTGKKSPYIGGALGQNYRLEILYKNYTGSVQSIEVSGAPAIYSCGDDKIFGIKGASLRLGLNSTGTLSIKNFYAEEDDEIKAILTWLGDNNAPQSIVLFNGYLVQDDYSEALVDADHEIQLSANDGLGLLKEAPFDIAAGAGIFLLGDYPTLLLQVANGNEVTVTIPITVAVGNTLEITGTSFDGSYTITAISGNTYTLQGLSTANTTTVAGVKIYGGFSPYERVTLLAIIQACLRQTGNSLPFNIYCNINEVSQDQAKSFLEQTLMDCSSFLTGDDEFDNCYSVLEKLCDRFGLRLFQYNNEWQAQWVPDYRRSLAPSGYAYSDSGAATGSISVPLPIQIQQGSDTEYEARPEERALRPFKFSRETFNYRQPVSLIRNPNFTILGDLIRQYYQGSNTIKEYKMPFWEWNGVGVNTDFFIRVIYDNIGNEIERFAVLKKGFNAGAGYRVVSNYFEIEKGTRVSVSMQYRVTTQVSSGDFNSYGVYYISTVGKNIEAAINDPSKLQSLQNPIPSGGVYLENAAPLWTAQQPGYEFVYPSDTREWTSVNIPFSPSAPINGEFRISMADLQTVNNQPGGETHYKDFNVQVEYIVNDSTKIIGHIHKNEQLGIRRTNDDVEIYADDTPRNSIAYTLFKNTKTGLLQDRTQLWKRNGVSEAVGLGELMTFEKLFLRRITKPVYEGQIHGLTQMGKHISLLTAMRFNINPNGILVFGLLEIDFKNNRLGNNTLYEITQTPGEPDSDLISDYTFKYIYKTD